MNEWKKLKLKIDRECGFDKNEYWLFSKSSELNESLDFYFYMRKKNRK